MKKYNIHLSPGISCAPAYSGGVYVSYSPEDCEINRKNSAGDDNTIWFCHAQPSMGIQYMQLVRAADRGAAGICMLNRNELLIDPFAQDLFKSADEKAIPVMIAIAGDGENGFKDKPGLPLLEHCLQDYKNVKFIVCGGGFWSELYAGQSDTLIQLFDKYTGIYADLYGIDIKENADKILAFLNSHPDRIFLGEDNTQSAEYYISNWLDEMHSHGRLSDETYEKICYKNAEKLILSLSKFDK